MRFSRASRLVAACLALTSLLFMQLAIASYACSGMAGGADAPMASGSSMPGMPGCQGMDKAQPALCHAAAHPHDHQSLDTPQGPALAPFIAAHAIPAPVPSMSAVPIEASAAPSTFLKRTTAPPIAIQHCCFRI